MLRSGPLLIPSFLAVLLLPPMAFAQDSASETSTNPFDDAASPSAEPTITKLYDVAVLVASQQPPLSINANLRVNKTDSSAVSGGLGGGMSAGGVGFGGGGMGGGTSGGGMFSVPSSPAQFGGGGLGGVAYQVPGQSHGNPTVSASTVAQIIQQMVAPESWSINGGSPGEISVFGDLLIVRQTEAVHKEVDDLLRSLHNSIAQSNNFLLEVWWLPVAESVQGELNGILNGPHDESAMTEKLTALCCSEAGSHGTMKCREYITGTMFSGKQTPVVVGSTPVVGTGSVGHAPIVHTLSLGILLEARISSIPVPRSSDNSKQLSEAIDFNFSSLITSPELKVEFCDEPGKIDRYTVGRHQADGTCRLDIGKPTIVASMTQVSELPANSSPDSELQLIVRVTRVDQ